MNQSAIDAYNENLRQLNNRTLLRHYGTERYMFMDNNRPSDDDKTRMDLIETEVLSRMNPKTN